VSRASWVTGLAVAVGAIVIASLAGCGDSDNGSGGPRPERLAPQKPVAVNIERLRALEESVGHPLYWAGQRPGRYELTVDVNGNVFIRYLAEAVQVGSRRTRALTVATYPYAGAYRTLHAASRQPGAAFARAPDGGLIVARNRSPDTVHIAYPHTDVQIEVYDPHAGRALELATAGAITPIR
jgi:hypothetical protein